MKSISIDIVLQELLERLEADAKALDCVAEISRAVEILKRGSSADQQLRVYEEARATGHNRVQALKQVVDWLQQETIR
jgi:glutamate---cysteine ligase / carboxylate-amine ligase